MLRAIAIALLAAIPAMAQEFEIRHYDLNATINVPAHSVEVQARLQLLNFSPPDMLDKLLLAGQDKPRLTFFLNAKSKVANLTINGNEVPIRTSEDVRTNLLRVSTDINSAIAKAREFEAVFKYTIDANDRTPFLRVSEGESFLLPPSQWFPVIHTPFGEHGADTAPFTLSVTAPAGLKVVSSGIRKSESLFEQPLAALPFFVAGDFEVLSQKSGQIEVYVGRGINEAGKKQAERLSSEAERVLTFCGKYFGAPSAAPWRAISTSGFGSTSVTSDGISQSGEPAFTTTATLILDDSFFRRDMLDLGTSELLVSSATRAWIDGRALIRGRGNGMLRDALPIYLVARYLGERNGAPQMEAAYERYRRAYIPLARGSDAPLLQASPIDRNYTSSMFNKGALVWRLLEKELGQSNLDGVVRQALDSKPAGVVSLVEWRSPLCGAARCANIKALLLGGGANRQTVNDIFTQWIETVVVPDFAVGQPQKASAGTESTIVNFGSGDFAIEVIATTDKGEAIRQTVTVKGGEYGSLRLPPDKTIVSIEADPQKLYPQKDFSNDSFPRRVSSSDLFGQANQAFSKGDLKTAEEKIREAVAGSPDSPSLLAFLGRVLLEAKKGTEAAQIFNSVLKNELPSIQAYAWAHLGLGKILAEQNKPVEAAAHFQLASAAELDAETTLAARNGTIAAEQQAGLIKIPEDVRAFLKQMDSSILQGSADAVSTHVDRGNLRRFAQSLVIRKPSAWTSEPTRVEDLDGNRVAVDVLLKLKIENRDYAGRALYVLRKAGGKLLLSEVPIFDVK